MLRRTREKGLRILRACTRYNRDRCGVSGLIAESNTQAKRKQQREHKNPEDHFRFAFQLQHARRQQMAVAGPASVPPRWTDLPRLACCDRCFLCHAHSCKSEEHTSELQSRQYLVCRLLLEKKKKHK